MIIKSYLKQNQGVTIIELLIVIAIIAILASFSASSFVNNIADYRLNSAARELMTNMYKAKMEAIKQNTSCRVVFDTNNERYAISIKNGDDGVWSSIDDNDNLKIVNLSEYYSGIEYGGGSSIFDATKDSDDLPDDGISYNN